MDTYVLFFLFVFVSLEGQSLSLSTCKPGELPCYNGQCLDRMMWCDTDYDCEDKSDEMFCRKGLSPGQDPNNCKANPLFFLCVDGSCIPKMGRCDGLYDCPDSSDEKNCTTEFKLDNKIPDFPDVSQTLKVDRDQNRILRLHRYTGESSSYEDIPYFRYRSQLNSAREWLKSQQKEDFGWGDYTARAIISMYLSRDDQVPKLEEDLLMDKQLDIELSIALTRNETSTLSLSELALYINALLAACKNPRNFYGYDLVNILRERADYVYPSRKFVSPLVYLTLCLSNATDSRDTSSLQDIFRMNQNIARKVDIQSLAILASSCHIKTQRFNKNESEGYRKYVVELLLNKLKESGLPGNIYELSLIMQALNEAKVDPIEWEREEAMQFILKSQNENGSFSDILATYYTIPILSGRSLLSLSEHCGKDFSNGKTPLAILKNARKRKITINYSLLFGDPVDMTQRVELQVADGTNFLDIMRLAEDETPNFRFSLDETKTVPFVYSIGGIPNDAERGLYWTLHTQNAHNAKDFIPYAKNIKDLVPRDGEEIRFWLKQI